MANETKVNPVGNPGVALAVPVKPAPDKSVEVVKEDRVPVSIQGHRRVPADPYDGPGNPAYEGDTSAKPKTQEELVAAIKSKK